MNILDKAFTDESLQQALQVFHQALRIRKIEEAIADKYSEQQMRCPTHLSIGQELVPCVLSAYLSKDDKVYSSHRAHAHYLAKGGDLKRLIAELYGKETGCTAGRGGSMHLCDLEAGFIASTAIVGNSIPLAVGNSLHQKLSNSNSLTVSYFGDGATEEGAFYESVNFAVLKSLPCLFVCENNFYSVYSSLEVRQPESRKIHRLAEGLGIKSLCANGNDYNELDDVCSEATKYIRKQNKPVFLELHTYRHREHCGPNFDDDLDYRPSAEVNRWYGQCPIANVEKFLSQSVNNEELTNIKHKILTGIENEIKHAFESAQSANFASEATNAQFLFAQ